MVKRLIVEMAERHQPDGVLIEDKGSGTQLIQDLRDDSKVYPIDITPNADKITRMYAQTAKIESGCVRIPASAAWLEDFRLEVLQFPRGRHDDQIDAMSQYLGWDGSYRIHNAPILVTPSRVAEQWDQLFGHNPRYW